MREDKLVWTGLNFWFPVRHVRSGKLLLCPNNKEKAEQTETNQQLYICKRSKVTGQTPVPIWKRPAVKYREGDFPKPKPTSTDRQELGPPARKPELQLTSCWRLPVHTRLAVTNSRGPLKDAPTLLWMSPLGAQPGSHSDYLKKIPLSHLAGRGQKEPFSNTPQHSVLLKKVST